MKPFHTAAVVFMGLVLVGCNENDHDSPLITKTTLKGVVIADGYLQGATVCLDNNNNLVCENTEPQDTTNAQGQYTLNNVATSDSANYAVIALVSVGAIIHNTTSQIVTKPYTLTTPLGKHGVISPITTFVAETMRANGNIDINTASQIVNYQMRVTDIDLFQDYSKNSTAIGKHLQSIALRANFSFGLNKEEIEADKSSALYSKVTLHTANILSKLSGLQLDIAFTNSYPSLYPNAVISIPTQYISNALSFLDKKSEPITKEELLKEPLLFIQNCVVQVECFVSRNGLFEYNQLKFETTASNIVISDNILQYNLTTGTTQTAAEPNTRYVLGENGWEQSNNRLIFNNTKEKTLIYKVDISNIPVKALTDQQEALINNQSYYQREFNINEDKKFPANSYAYKLIRIRLADEYSVNTAPSILVDNSEVKTINEFKNIFFTNHDNIQGIDLGGLTLEIRTSSNLVEQHTRDFNPKLRTNKTVALVIKSTHLQTNQNTDITTTTEENGGTWEEATINSVKLLTIKVNSFKLFRPLKNYNFYTELNSKLVVGSLEAAGYVREDLLFNQTAMDAIKSAIDPKAIP